MKKLNKTKGLKKKIIIKNKVKKLRSFNKGYNKKELK